MIFILMGVLGVLVCSKIYIYIHTVIFILKAVSIESVYRGSGPHTIIMVVG